MAGFTYYEGILVFKNFKIGAEPNLKAETNNKYVPQAEVIYSGEHKIGFMLQNANYSLNKLLDKGQTIFETWVQFFNKLVTPESR